MIIRYQKSIEDAALYAPNQLDDPENSIALAVGGVRRSHVDTAAQTITLSMKHTRTYPTAKRNRPQQVIYEGYSITLTRAELDAALAHFNFVAQQESTE